MKGTKENLEYDTEVVERLPYWIRELFKILEKTRGGSRSRLEETKWGKEEGDRDDEQS